MKDAVAPPNIVRFATFEVDLRAGELRKAGLKLKLTGQPFQVLAILLEHPGEVVAREGLQNRLWPDTFVDAERGLNTAINKIREVLGDSAENPRFLETLPRKGYRFIGQVNGSAKELAAEPAPPPPAVRNWKARIALGVAVLGVIVLAGSVPFVARRQPPTPLQPIPLTALSGQEVSPTFSPDGSQVAFGWDGENNGAGYDLYVKVIGTDKPLRLTNHPANWLATAWSPDGRYIAVHRSAGEDTGIYLVPALGGPERKLIATHSQWPPATPISWSPDGKQLAFVEFTLSGYSAPLFLLSLDTLERKKVETGCRRVQAQAFSPGGDLLAYVCEEDPGRTSLNLFSLNEDKSTRIFAGPITIAGVAWSRDGKRLIFAFDFSFIHGGAGELWQVAPVPGGVPEKVSIGHDVESVAISSSGNRLAYEQFWYNTNIWRLGLDGAKPHVEKLIASTLQQYLPSISPNGSKIVFVSTRSGTQEIWTCDRDGKNAVQLTSVGGALTGTPRWSPDGKQIVFDSRAEGKANLYVVDAGGGVPRKLDTGTQVNSMPSWSHDGHWIYFVNGEEATLWKWPVAGGRAIQLTHTPGNMMSAESPDGRYIYFAAHINGVACLWRVSSGGADEQPVAGVPPLSGAFGWWPVASGIYFIAEEAGKPQISFLDTQTSQIRRIFSLEKPSELSVGGLAVSPDGKWLLYSQVDETASDLMLVENFR